MSRASGRWRTGCCETPAPPRHGSRRTRPSALLGELEATIARAPLMRATGLARARKDIARLVEETNRAITRVDVEAPTLRQHRRSFDLTVELERLERAADGQPPGAVGS